MQVSIIYFFPTSHSKTHGILSRQVVDAVGKSGQSMPLLRDKPGVSVYVDHLSGRLVLPELKEAWDYSGHCKRVVGDFLGDIVLEPIEIQDFEI